MADENAALLALLNGAAGSRRSRGDSALEQFQDSLNDTNYWNIAAVPLANARFNTSTWSPGETAAVSFGQSFLSGLLAGLGKKRDADQMSAVSKVLPQLYSEPEAVNIPEGVDTRAFEELRQSALRENAIRAAKAEENKQNLINQLALDLFRENPKMAAKVISANSPEFGATIKEINLTDKAKDLPPAIQTRVLEESERAKNMEKSLNFIDEKFKRAKKLTGADTTIATGIGVPTYKANELKSLNDSIIFQIDATMGRELNSDVRERISSLGPKPYDSEAELDRKAKDMKSLVSALSKSTPVLDMLSGESVENLPSPIPAPTPAVNLKDFIRQGRASGLSKEQIEAEWVKVGGRL